ncbi:MAG: hypothetical protein ABI082_15395, partial [Dokdonella sp.]
SGPVNTMAPQADGKLIIGGNFYAIAGGPQSRIARLNVDGSLDTSFANIGVNSNITAVAVQPDGKVLIGGDFDQVGGQARHHLARLNADGTLDSAFADPGLDGGVVAIAVQRDGSVVVGGSFTKVGSVAKNYLARLDAQGGFDQNSFANPQLCCGPVRSVALQADGNVLVGGYFSQVGTASQFYFARFSASGAFDATFPNIGRDIQAGSIVVAPDGSVYVADVGAEYVVKLTAGGTAAPGFTSAVADSTINAIALQPNGKVVISGIFQTVGGQARHGMARLNADGSLDATFADPQLSLDSTHPNGYVYGVGAQSDGNIVAVGNFSLASGQPRNLMARITTGDYVKNALTVQPGSGNLIATWTRAGDGPELVQAPNLGHSTDGVNFTIVGPMTRIANGWQVTAPYNVHGSLFYLRASGTTSNGAGNGSPGQIASDVFFSDTIFKSGFE